MTQKIRKTLHKLRPELVKEWDFRKNTLNPETVSYLSPCKVWWKCEAGHSWELSIASRVKSKSGCPYCSYRLTLKEFNDLGTTHPELLKQWCPSNESKPTEFTHKSKKEVYWICKNGHRTLAPIRNRAKGITCFKCSILPKENQGKKAFHPKVWREIHPIYSKEKNLFFAKSSKKILWLGEDCQHEWFAEIGSRNKGKGLCPFCSNRKLLTGFNDIVTLHPALIENEWCFKKNKISPLDIGTTHKDPVYWKCCNCNIEEMCRIEYRIKRGCLNCSKKSSKLEQIVFDYIHLNYNRLKIQSRQRIIPFEKSKKEIDILIDELKIGIEIQDFLTHSKYSDNEFGHPWSKDNLKNGPSYHKEKALKAKERLGIIIHEIWEDEILNGTFKEKLDKIILDKESEFKHECRETSRNRS